VIGHIADDVLFGVASVLPGVSDRCLARLDADDPLCVGDQGVRKSATAAIRINEKLLFALKRRVEELSERDRHRFIHLLEEWAGAARSTQRVIAVFRLGKTELVQRFVHLGLRDHALLDVHEVPRFKAEEPSDAFRAMNPDAIAIAVVIHRGNDRLHRHVAQLSHPPERLLHLLLLQRELRVVPKVLVDASSAATEIRTGRSARS
jgi:hypothetical protein